jgi:hypothetical protein
MGARNLKTTRYSPQYRRRLLEALLVFLAWLHEQQPKMSLTKLGAKPLAACRAIELFLQDLYEKNSKHNLTVGRHALLSLEKRLRHLRGHLGECWEILESWRQEIPGVLRAPIYLPAVLAMSLLSRVLAEASSGFDSYLWMAMGVLLETGFFALLRPGELLALTRDHVSLAGQLLSVGAGYAVCMIKNPKNRRQFGLTQFAVVRSKNTSDWLGWLCSELLGPEKLWPGTVGDFRDRFKVLLKYLALESVGFVLASLRAGGATYLFMAGIDPPRIKFYGRWASERSLGHYLQESVAAQLANSTSVKSQKLISLVLSSCDDLLVPPAFPPSAKYPRKATARGVARKLEWQLAGKTPILTTAKNAAWERLYPKPS